MNMVIPIAHSPKCYLCYQDTDCPRISLYNNKLDERVFFCSDECLKKMINTNGYNFSHVALIEVLTNANTANRNKIPKPVGKKPEEDIKRPNGKTYS